MRDISPMLQEAMAEMDCPTSDARFQALFDNLCQRDRERLASYVSQIVYVPMTRH